MLAFILVVGIVQSVQITVVHDGTESIVQPMVEALKFCLAYYQDVHTIKSLTDLNILEYNIETFENDVNGSSFVISLATGDENIREIMSVNTQLMIPTIQTRYKPWMECELDSDVGIDETNSTDIESSSENYVVLVPSFIVQDNMLCELAYLLRLDSKIVVIYDEAFQNTLELEWRRPFATLSVPVLFEPMRYGTVNITKHLYRLKFSVKNIFFIGTTKVIEDYIKISEAEMGMDTWRWIVFTRDSRPPKCRRCSSAHFLWAYIQKSTFSEELSEFVDFIQSQEVPTPAFKFSRKSYHHQQTAYALDILHVAVQLLFSVDDKQLRSVDSRTLKEVMNLKWEYQFGHYIQHHGNLYYQNITGSVIRVDRDPKPKEFLTKQTANWTFTDGMTLFYPSIDIDLRQSNHLRVVTIIQEPFVQLDDEKGFAGYCIDLLEMIREEMNFTYELFLIPDGKFGSLQPTGNWNGMIGALVAGQADLALGPLSLGDERQEDVDFAFPYYEMVGTAILMRRNDIEVALFKFLTILEAPVWVCIFIAYFVTSTLLYVLDKISPDSHRNKRRRWLCAAQNGDREFTYTECLWFCMTSLTPQGGGEPPRNLSGRVLAASWWLFGFVIVASFTAKLAAFLTISRTEHSILDIDSLSAQYKIQYAPLKGSGTEVYFKRMAEIEEKIFDIFVDHTRESNLLTIQRSKMVISEYPVSDKYTNIWRFMQQSELPYTTEEAIQRVLESENGFAFIGDAMQIKYAALVDCRLQKVGPEFNRNPYAIGLQKGSRWKDPISETVIKLMNSRKLEMLKTKWWDGNPKRRNCVASDEEATGIAIQKIGGLFILIICGIIAALPLVGIEWMYRKRRSRLIQPSESVKIKSRPRPLPALDVWATGASLRYDGLTELQSDDFEDLRERTFESAPMIPSPQNSLFSTESTLAFDSTNMCSTEF